MEGKTEFNMKSVGKDEVKKESDLDRLDHQICDLKEVTYVLVNEADSLFNCLGPRDIPTKVDGDSKVCLKERSQAATRIEQLIQKVEDAKENVQKAQGILLDVTRIVG